MPTNLACSVSHVAKSGARYNRLGTALLDISMYMIRSIEDYDDESAANATAEEIHPSLNATVHLLDGEPFNLR
ncbi:hypothetical protein OPQ81_003236 [Rhizoctonia solani]|nr:hypothetical protein OPQ81_003236 [Rhizoctonia solani]